MILYVVIDGWAPGNADVNADGKDDMKPWRIGVARLGYALVGSAVLIVLALWSRTCALGGFHCFDGGAGHAVAVAQMGILSGLLCSLFGTGWYRILFVVAALAELALCYLQGLVH